MSPDFASDGRAWAAVFGGRVFSSADALRSWHESHTGLTDPVVTGITASPAIARDHVVFAAADDGVFRSSDDGSTWINSSIGLRGRFSRSVVLSSSFEVDHTAYVATDGGVYRSNDAGSTWTPPQNDARSVLSLVVASGQGESTTLYAGLDAGGMETSVDGGKNWSTVSGFPQSRRVLAMAVDSKPASSLLFAATDDGIWRTADEGTTWRQTGGSGDRISSLTSDGQRLYAGSASGHGVLVSEDAGTSWHAAGSPSVAYITALTAGLGYRGPVVMAGTAGGGVEISSDSGATWQPSNVGLHAAHIASLRALGPGIGVAGNGGGDVRGDGEMLWRHLSLPSHFITALDGRGRDLFAGTQDNGLQLSGDGGATWKRAPLQANSVSQLVLAGSESSSPVLIVAADYVYWSADRGQSLVRATGVAGNDVRCFAVSPRFEQDGVVLAGTVSHGVYRSNDGGRSWIPASKGLPNDTVTGLLFSSGRNQGLIVYAATAGGGIWISDDLGTSWRALSPSAPDGFVTALASEGNGDLVVGTEKGLFEKHGDSWMRLAGDWDSYVTALVDRRVAGEEILYVGTYGDGTWTLAVPAAASESTSASLPTQTTAVPTPTATRQVPSAPASHSASLRPRLSVIPTPVVAGEPALIAVRGPHNGRMKAVLAARGWRRIFSAQLARDGRAGIGFIAPARPFTARIVVQSGARTGQISISVPVVPR